ncbi:polysaccharide deacetylase family protein [Candidatus Pelagibacter sp.]|nr:polysaccharide deacetylase family protein [Candidatus Pelagibacter sp.]
MSENRILSSAALIIKVFIFFIIFLNVKADVVNKKYFKNEQGILAIMYHRFEENKYPSTNIKLDIFKKHLNLIKNNNLNFYNPGEFLKNFKKVKKQKKILLTIDDAFMSFYENAWPILKQEKIPFILFVSTEAVGNRGYMNWSQIKEVEKEYFAYIGNHSHSHDYLTKFSFEKFKRDIDKSIKIFNNKLGYNPIFFSYPFGEYNSEQKNYISNKFEFAFGQHSGVIDLNKDRHELPRFPINEKYGEINRFSEVISYLPLQYKVIKPENKFMNANENPPKMIIEFFTDQKNLKNINCFSNEGSKWRKTNIVLNGSVLKINFAEKFNERRGRINCSLKDEKGWRFAGFQFVQN